MAWAWMVHLLRIYYEANGCANALVKMDCQQQSILKVYDPCLSFVYPTFVWDIKHLGTSRMWNLNSFGLAIV